MESKTAFGKDVEPLVKTIFAGSSFDFVGNEKSSFNSALPSEIQMSNSFSIEINLISVKILFALSIISEYTSE